MASIWTTETTIRKRDSLPGDLQIPAVVIGAGLTGILTAYFLQQAGISTIVLEADRIGSGQTKNTTAKITSQHSLIYDHLIQTFGRESAAAYAQANETAISDYEQLIREKGIACDFVKCPACLYSRSEKMLLQQEAAAAASVGIQASFATDSELPFHTAGVVRFENQARFEPLPFLASIAEEITVYEKTRVLKVEGSHVLTDRGCVTAGHIIFAAHYPFLNVPGYYFARMYQKRSYVLALEGTPLLEAMYLGIDPDGLSFRSQRGKLLLGGCGHRTGSNRQGGQYEMLREAAKSLYPGCIETAHWSAQDCMTLDGLPYIGRFSRRMPDWYLATGFGKWGMTSAMASARILTALITGHDCPQAAVFSPQRHFTFRAAREFVFHTMHTAVGLTKHLLPAHNDKFIPNCPHMGCRLEWNPEEETYDCPCHGSRFQQDGRLMDGPAQTDCIRRVSDKNIF